MKDVEAEMEHTSARRVRKMPFVEGQEQAGNVVRYHTGTSTRNDKIRFSGFQSLYSVGLYALCSHGKPHTPPHVPKLRTLRVLA